MKNISFAFSINSFYKAEKTIECCIEKKIFPIVFIKYFIVNGFGYEWVIELRNLLEKKFTRKKFDIYVDCKKNYGLFICLVENKIDYLKIDAKNDTYERLNEIAKKNRVLLNPKFSIVDLDKVREINKKINKLLV